MNHHQICVNSLLCDILFISRVHYVVHLCKKDRGGPVWMGMIRTRSLYLGHCYTFKVLFLERKNGILIIQNWIALFCAWGKKTALSRLLFERKEVHFGINMSACNTDRAALSKHTVTSQLINFVFLVFFGYVGLLACLWSCPMVCQEIVFT